MQTFERVVVAEVLGNGAAVVQLGPMTRSRSERRRHGPWTLVVDVPRPGRDLLGPPPVYLALAGWATCSTVTIAGVANRNRIPLHGVDIDLAVSVEDPDVGGRLRVRKTLRLEGPPSADAQAQLRNASEYCSVGKMFTKRSLTIIDEIESIGTTISVGESTAVDPMEASAAAASVPSGTVASSYLADTKEYLDDKLLDEEGEVKIYIACDNRTGPGRWALLAGHTSEGWLPPPVPLALGGLAGSTALTLQQALPRTRLHVEMHRLDPPTGRDKAQANASACKVDSRRILRRVVVDEALDERQLAAVRSSLERDVVTTAIRSGDSLLSADLIAP